MTYAIFLEKCEKTSKALWTGNGLAIFYEPAADVANETRAERKRSKRSSEVWERERSAMERELGADASAFDST